MAKHVFRPHYTCGRLGYCAKDYKVLNRTEYIQSVIADKPKKEYPIPSKTQTYKALHISDIHLDLDYTEGNLAACNEPTCCRPENGKAPNASVAALKWGTEAGPCDIPMRTVEQFMNQLSKMSDEIDMVIWTGDNVAHDLWDQS